MKNILHLALFAGIVIGATSCKKQAQVPATSGKALTSAQQIFQKQQENFPKTKSANWQDIARPLPADFTPIWEKAIESNNGSVTYVTVPISTPTRYTALFPCTEPDKHNQNHDHGSVAVVQKLVVYMSDDSSGCYIVNIVPFSDCELSTAQINTGFDANSGMVQFTGFAACHTLKGEMVHIDRYNGGTKQSTFMPDDEQAGIATKYARLYLNDIRPMTTRAVPSNFNPFQYGYCDICRQPCGNPYNASVFYDASNYKDKDKYGKTPQENYNQNEGNRSAHCFSCNRLKTNCQCPGDPIIPPVWCAIHKTYTYICKCGGGPSPSQNCYFCQNNPCSNPFYASGSTPKGIHVSFLYSNLMNVIPIEDHHRIQQACYDVDMQRQSSEDLHMHNLWDPYTNYNEQYTKLRNWFIERCMFNILGDALHPVLDIYEPISVRKDMLNYSVYYSMGELVQRMPSMSDKSQGFMSVFNAIKALNIGEISEESNPAEYEAAKTAIGQVFDRWASGQRF